MKYFFDTEFITGFKKPIQFLPTIGNWNKKDFYIHLVSIGIKAEDGREYYAISNEFNPKLADDWVKENVLRKLPESRFNGSNIQEVKLWKSNKKIAEEILDFVQEPFELANAFIGGDLNLKENDIQFYAYYADYDWVVFCSLFGRMIDLPKGFPMYCKDLKQILDEKAKVELDRLLEEQKNEELLNFIPTIDGIIKSRIKHLPNFPKQENEHNALDDAKWNYDLYKFLKTI